MFENTLLKQTYFWQRLLASFFDFPFLYNECEIKIVPQELWMHNAHLYIQEDKCGCADSRALFNERDLGEILFRPEQRYQPDLKVTFITPQAEAVKNRNEIGEAYLDFVVGKYDIKPVFRRNPIELEKVHKLILDVLNDKNLVINQITFTGKASPEAPYAYNMRLSANRAKALMDYVNRFYKLQPEWMQSQPLGEDWEAFERIVNETPMEYKEEVLAIIRSREEPDRKEAQLKALHSGKAYRHLNAEVFPQLRRVECRVDYTVRAFSPEEGREIIKTHPQQLSLNEMFLVANTYENGSKDFNEVFNIAAQQYPDDDIANFNAASAAMLAKDYVKARQYINRCKITPEKYNNLGALYLVEGDLENAERYLLQAQEAGIPHAQANLKELQKKKEDNELFDSFDN